jgi:2-methylisocitrate lyase-like PEP mutase family enzyme
MPTLAEKADLFRAMHAEERAFIIPNPWDAGTARLLEQFGFRALATTSAGYAFSEGKCDNAVGRNDMLEHVKRIAAATTLPVSADLENGFGDSPESAAETITLAGMAGIVGGSIEDATGSHDHPIYEASAATERIKAAVQAARSLPFYFTLTARAENFIHGRKDLKDTIRRLQSYQEAGADVLYAPGLTTKEEITAVVSSLDRPVNILMGSKGVQFSAADLSGFGVKRISVGSCLSRAALGAFIRAAKEMQESGTFAFGNDAVTYAELNQFFAR